MRRAAVLMLVLCAAFPAHAQTIDELKAQLEAQLRINDLLKQRIRTLEGQVGTRVEARPTKPELRPTVTLDDPETDRALERALQRQNVAVLPAGVSEVAPSLFWSHSGRDAIGGTRNTYGGALDIRTGLAGGWMLGLAAPFLHRDLDGVGRNTGAGDISVSVSKHLFSETASLPSLTGSIIYSAPTGDDAGDDDVALGAGFHSVTGRLAALKTIQPAALFGDVSYTTYFADTVSGVDLERSDQFGVRGGVSLAVTPDLSLSAAVNLAFEDELRSDGVQRDGTGVTLGFVELGAGFLLDRDIFLGLSGSFGVTDDSPDLTLGVSLPIRF